MKDQDVRGRHWPASGSAHTRRDKCCGRPHAPSNGCQGPQRMRELHQAPAAKRSVEHPLGSAGFVWGKSWGLATALRSRIRV